MKKLVLRVCLCLWGIISCGPEAAMTSDGIRSESHSLATTLPPVQTYPTTAPLPTGSYTHLVVSYCEQDGQIGDLMAAAVNASTGTVVFRLQASTSTDTRRFLGIADDLGVPLTVYNRPVEVILEEEEPTTPPSGGTPLPMANPIHWTCTNEEGGSLPETGDPMGGEEAPGRWNLFTRLALNTAEALHKVARLAPPPPQPQ